MKNKNKKVILFLIIALVIVVIGTSFALNKYSTLGSKNNVFKTGTLVVNMKDGDSLTLLNSVPMADSQIDSLDGYSFTINNTGSLEAKYEISLIEDSDKYVSDGCSDMKLPFTSLKYSISNGETTNIDSLDDTGKIMYDTIKSGDTKNYTLKLWINSNAGNEVENKHLHAKLKVKVIPSSRTDYDTGA